MVFSSNLFLYAVLPAFLALYYLCPGRLRNAFLFLVSILFYFWSSGPAVVMLLVCVLLNYYAGAMIARSSESKAGRILGLAIAANILVLIYYKYAGFFTVQLGSLLDMFSVSWHPTLKIVLPLGISFFIFKAIAYQIEVYHQVTPPADSFIEFGAYLTLFPQLAAGPIARYSDTRSDLRQREVSIALFFEGVQRFSLGLGKKVLIANPLGLTVDRIFSLTAGELTTPVAWLGAVCYTFQIYFDFSGYTDMAIGLGNFLGFRFPENFDQPYRARNITEFWRRWHMTLSFWFRDFLFLPLELRMARWGQSDQGSGRFREAWRSLWNGKRGPAYRTCVSFMVVFSLCGLWHGAAWTFILWGAFHGFCLAGELVLKKKFKWQPTGVSGTCFTFLLLTIGWVMFRSDSLAGGWNYLRAMFGMSPENGGFIYFPLRFYLQNDLVCYLVVAAIFAWLPVESLKTAFQKERLLTVACRGFASILILAVSSIALSTAGFNPFIYFRF